MNKNSLTPQEKQIRQNIRNFLLIATKKELETEYANSIARNDSFRAECIQELIDEYHAENLIRELYDRP